MLSPAVRAAAAAYAASQGTPVVHAVAQGYLTGYTAGYTARRPERFPLAGDQQLKRLLGAYLAENITVYHPHSGRYGKLMGLPACYDHDGEPFAEVEFYADAEARKEGCGDITERESKLLPCLYGFCDLDKKLPQPNGQPLLVLEEIIASLYAGPVDVFKASYGCAETATGKLKEWWTVEFATHEGTGCEATFFNSGAAEIEEYPVNATFLLQQYGFAVGLAPHQYHRRQPGFDYASGGKPASQPEQEVSRA